MYSKIEHFNRRFFRFQNKKVIIPSSVYETILMEIKKDDLTIDEITISKVKSYLKTHKLRVYYEDVPHIITKLKGEHPKFSYNLKEYLRDMFKRIQKPWENHKPKNRRSFISCDYIFHKFLELLGEYRYLHYYPLLKSREKLIFMDNIWQKICADLDWKFIPTKFK